MTAWHAIGLAVAAYLMLLARSAWKQGELKQFLFSLGLVALLLAALAAIVGGYVYLDTR